MGVTTKNFLNNFKTKDILFKVISINAIIFLLIAVINVFCKLFMLPVLPFDSWLAVPSSISEALIHCWTLFSYMFIHYEILHILFNMLVLYWFGKIFLMFFTPKNFMALYIIGGLGGALLFIITSNSIPFFITRQPSFLIGASASVTAIIFGIALYKKDLRVSVFFIGSVKIIYIAIAIFLMDFISLGNSVNAGGHVAHIGGALIGLLFAWQYSKGRDITKGFNKCIDSFFNLFKKQPKMKIKYTKKETDYEYNQRKHEESEDIDTILDKIKQSGYKSLTDNERRRLFDASNK